VTLRQTPRDPDLGSDLTLGTTDLTNHDSVPVHVSVIMAEYEYPLNGVRCMHRMSTHLRVLNSPCTQNTTA
jgi:hypothetical protein